jgi:hypothetical protein
MIRKNDLEGVDEMSRHIKCLKMDSNRREIVE